MAKKKAASKRAPTKTASRTSGSVPRRTSGGFNVPSSGSGGAPAGINTSTLAADVSGELRDAVPTFGNVLGSIGRGVAASQEALDQSLIDAVNDLSDTKITVVTDVVQKLDDDGLPVTADTELITNELSVLNFVTPTVHEWSHVGLSMDLNVGSFDAESNMTFSREQHGGGVSGYGLFWGFVGWNTHYEYDHYQDGSSSTDTEVDWARGQVRLDAQLQPRRTTKFPVPAEVSIGPQIYFSQGSINETTDSNGRVTREVDVEITVLKANGDENPSKVLEVSAGSLQVSFSTEDSFTGSTTNSDGKVKVTLTRNIPNALFGRAGRYRVTAKLGAITKTLTITL